MYPVFILAIFALLPSASGLIFSPYENLTSGIWDVWNETNPDNVNQGRFSLQYGYGNLWLVSKRLYRKGTDHPWDPASRGGIVSTFRVSTKAWTHKSYGRLEEDKYGEKLFSLNGRLFMLTYSYEKRAVAYHKLFFWKDEDGKWVELPMEIDPLSMVGLAPYAIPALCVSVPKQEGKVAYLVSSLHADARAGSEMVYAKLEAEFNGNVPVKAALKGIVKHKSDKPTGVFFTALLNNTLYAFTEDFLSEGYVPEHSQAYSVDLTSKSVGRVNLTGPLPPMEYSDVNMFQTKNDEIFIAGGIQTYGLGQLREIHEIWSMKLKTLEWQFTNSSLPSGVGSMAYDQQGGKFYLAGLKEGIQVARVSA